MFERIFDFLVAFLSDLLPVTVVQHYNRGVRQRFGKKHGGVLEPGLHWKIPFVDQILEEMVKPKTMNLSAQTITTKDWKTIVVQSVIKYEIKDPITTLMEVNDPVDAVSDMTKGIIRNAIIERRWEDCNNTELSKEIRNKARNEAEKWGIKIIDVTLTDLAEIASYRIIGGEKFL